MNVTEAIVERRSIKAFDPAHKMTDKEVAKLMSLAMLSPTAFNKAWEKDTGRYWVNAPKAAQERLVPMIHSFYQDKEQVQRDEGMRSGGMAAMTLMLAAKEMGYDTCPMDGFDFEAVSKLINLPADHTPVMFVAVGKALEEARARGGQLDFDEVVIKNTF